MLSNIFCVHNFLYICCRHWYNKCYKTVPLFFPKHATIAHIIYVHHHPVPTPPDLLPNYCIPNALCHLINSNRTSLVAHACRYPCEAHSRHFPNNTLPAALAFHKVRTLCGMFVCAIRDRTTTNTHARTHLRPPRYIIRRTNQPNKAFARVRVRRPCGTLPPPGPLFGFPQYP